MAAKKDTKSTKTKKGENQETKDILALISRVEKEMNAKRRKGQSVDREIIFIQSLEERKETIKKRKNMGGRKIFDGLDEWKTFGELCQLWGYGLKDSAAARKVGITKQSLSQYLDKNPLIAEYREGLQDDPYYNAKIAIGKRLELYAESKEGELNESLKFVQATKPDEFGAGRFEIEELNEEREAAFGLLYKSKKKKK